MSEAVAFQSSDRIATPGVAGFHVFEGSEYVPAPFLEMTILHLLCLVIAATPQEAVRYCCRAVPPVPLEWPR